MQDYLFGVYCHLPRVSSVKGYKLSEAVSAVEYRCKPVICITTGTIYSSVAEASVSTKVSMSSIVNCCRGRAKTAGRMKWSYVEHLPKQVRVRVKSRKGGFSEYKLVGV